MDYVCIKNCYTKVDKAQLKPRLFDQGEPYSFESEPPEEYFRKLESLEEEGIDFDGASARVLMKAKWKKAEGIEFLKGLGIEIHSDATKKELVDKIIYARNAVAELEG